MRRWARVKSLVKKVQAAVAEKKVEDAKASLRQATSALGKAVTKGVMKPNTASRRIARLTLPRQLLVCFPLVIVRTFEMVLAFAGCGTSVLRLGDEGARYGAPIT